MLKNRILTALMCLFIILLTITFSISLPIYIRPIYYAHIEPLNLEESTGKSKAQIIEAYDEVLDYLTLPGKEFGTGEFKHSQNGKSHFEDCKILFDINIITLVVSLLGIIVLCLFKQKKFYNFSRPFGLHFLFACGALPTALFLIIGAIASIDFDKAFEVFHKIFFYGKENWIFDYREDEIIKALPQEFFLNCAVIIAVSVILLSLALIVFGIIKSKKIK